MMKAPDEVMSERDAFLAPLFLVKMVPGYNTLAESQSRRVAEHEPYSISWRRGVFARDKLFPATSHRTRTAITAEIANPVGLAMKSLSSARPAG